MSQAYSSFSLARSKVQNVYNVLNSSIGTSRVTCACTKTALGRSTTKLIRTGLLMIYPTLHISFRLIRIFKYYDGPNGSFFTSIRILNSEFRILNSEFRILNSEFSISKKMLLIKTLFLEMPHQGPCTGWGLLI